jgi:hypothetical protein
VKESGIVHVNQFNVLDIDRLDSIIISIAKSDNLPSIELKATLIGQTKAAEAIALVDSGATGNLINKAYVQKHNIQKDPLERPVLLKGANGAEGAITHVVNLGMELYNSEGEKHEENIRMYVANIDTHDVILGTPWLIKHNPSINWASYDITFTWCPEICKQGNKQRHTKPAQWTVEDNNEEPAEEHIESWCTQQQHEVWISKLSKQRPVFARISGLEQTSYDLTKWSNMAQKLAQEAAKKKVEKPVTEMVPHGYHDYLDVFSEERAKQFPKSRSWDHKIETKPGYIPRGCRVNKLSPVEDNLLKEWIKENLETGYICVSKSPQASPFFFVGKKDGKLRPTQDYRYINEWTIRNDYPLTLITEIPDKLKGARYFTALDIRQGYNNVRIADGHQWKATFKCKYGLFEPMVMFFGLCNLPATFQAMMNKIFADLINQNKVIIYLDDILIYSKTKEEHQEITRKVLQRLRDNDLYLKAEKCKFMKEKLEYLGLIILHNHIEMDPVKVEGITEWPRPTKVKDVQAFLGFCNFYRRFIQDFSKIAQPLYDLTQKNFEWNWSGKCKEAFTALKNAFTKSPMLVMPDTAKKMQVECDASDFARGAVLSQLEEDGLYHPVAYLSKSLVEPERNYNIHNKELLAIIGALETWQHYLEGAKERVEIWTDHKNLEYFRKAQKLSRRQARWAQFLTRFDFDLLHKRGETNKVDGLSQRIDHKHGVENNNADQTLLPEQLFKDTITTRNLFIARPTTQGQGSTGRKEHTKVIRTSIETILNNNIVVQGNTDLKGKIQSSVERDKEVIKAMDTIKGNGPQSMTKGLQEWNMEDGLILFRGKVYVPKDNNLRREVVRSYHDPPAMGHPGRYQMLELVTQNYWWPGISSLQKTTLTDVQHAKKQKTSHTPRKNRSTQQKKDPGHSKESQQT